MFTGLIETTAEIAARAAREGGAEFTLRCPAVAGELVRGESVACSGCCLTVETAGAESFTVFASPETLARTTLADCAVGDALNIERSLKLGDRMGGHLVSGHVDGVGEIVHYRARGDAWDLRVRGHADLAPLLVEKGSVAVDGISLTCFDIEGSEFSVAVIPETHTRTALHTRAAGDRVNLEGDLIGKFVAQQMTLRGQSGSGVTEDLLRAAGFLPDAAPGVAP